MSADATVGNVAEPWWKVVESAIATAERTFGDRLVAVYVLGSLAHGGFSPLVSDIDVALVLRSPTDDGDIERVHDLQLTVNGSGLELADRLSVFWCSPDHLAGRPTGPARFPPLDLVDLHDSGRLMAGSDLRAGMVAPTRVDLLRSTAEFALEVLARPERRRHIVDPWLTARGGPRIASKTALFPVRFLYTARTGAIGHNEEAARHYLALTRSDSKRALVEAALGWRERWNPERQDHYVRLLAAAPDLYCEFADEYAQRLADAGLADLGEHLHAWAQSLSERTAD